MKLISFAALSFLAITVSAYPGLDTPSQSTTTHSALQHQSTTAQNLERHQDVRSRSGRKHYKQLLQAELEKLGKEYKEKRALVGGMKALINTMKTEQSELKKSIDALEETDPNKAEMVARRISQTSAIKKELVFLNTARHEMKDAEEQRDIVEAKLISLSEF
ncbi:hypothetical protein BASA50_007331 [Batrachochytrium salamandrivorans]|uniref:Uncharacterized protein n=1 Tax=Batrachochytrium salamandrivorans TaxID=1357716 RepID=A0ABQ8F746_9FUNG|nr:hypothetical protein BASA60_009699 [Batrachochytrium salamandrivorans]KAH6571045.1 hypothetical protein BASA62_004072 [Batrachochytrium salamandrivorans]KAH6593379.1 hypothetical protein BASA50_007331 [Batrachochytrium salamandrivorans]KAH6599314.1 hypothetical protein BASA61_002603 [Batrachochytrium salamandrivorans]KAH9256794.1 hypothetical protein BASA81_005088 [Batrachochytrium salamandrivorans]